MNKKRTIAIVVIVLALIALLGTVGYLIFKTLNSRRAEDDYNKIASSYAANINETVSPETLPSGAATQPAEKDKPVPAPQADNPVDLKSLMAQNPDIYSWLYVPNTNINYPVAQSDYSDDFYLHSDIYKNYSFPGTIYSQMCNKRDWSDRVTVLYGHNMLDGSMFASLHNFEDTDFFNSNRYFYIYTKDRKLTYQIVSAYVYDDRHIMNSFDFSKDNVFQEWLDEAKNPRSVIRNADSSVKLDLNSKMVVLSTCNANDIGRYLVQGVLINDEKTQ